MVILCENICFLKFSKESHSVNLYDKGDALADKTNWKRKKKEGNNYVE